MNLRIKILSLLLVFANISVFGQNSPFQLILEPISVPNLAGMHAFVYGQSNGKWLVLGGRIDGLHKRQPNSSFDVAGQNKELTVVDPITMQKWSASITTLPTAIQEQFSSTNMEFYQEGDYLYIIGGYGYSNTSANHITYSYLTVLKVSDVIDAVINGSSFVSYFRQISDAKFAVTGGYLNKIYDKFYLTGGQLFTGRYNPMNQPSFTQQYTNAIRIFKINDDGVNLMVTHLAEVVDSVNLHRRDYNVAHQIMPNGEEGLTAFSGVFQQTVNLPFLNSVNIDSSGYSVNNTFSQYYNHYHCAHLPIYRASNNQMHTVFFGGIAQYYDSSGVMVQDNNVPFVKTIARVTREANGNMAEFKLPIEMPALLGAGSEFIPVENLPRYTNHVLKLDDLVDDTTLVGYIYGGINSSAANIFFINDGTQSSAENQIFKVLLVRDSTVGVDEINNQSVGGLQMQVYPSPNEGSFMISFSLKEDTKVRLTILDSQGKLIDNSILQEVQVGKNLIAKKIDNLIAGGVYFITLETNVDKAVQKIIVKPRK